MAREDLNPVEAARACSVLVEELGLTRDEVGRRVGRSRVAVSNLIRLLDLPDEALDLLVTGVLSEGHGRALLLAPDHGDRKRLARAAATEGWTVRQTEARARDRANPAPGRGTGARKPRPRMHPDQEAAAQRISETLERALGSEVEVAPTSTGWRVALVFGSFEEAEAAAERLGQALETA